MFGTAKPPHLKRSLKTLNPGSDISFTWNGKSYINFASNDYLGLSHHPKLKESAIRLIEQYGVGAGSSRLVSGSHTYHDQLETRLAEETGFESALLMNTGYQGNVSVLAALADRDTLIFMDRHCHHSLVQGARLSGAKIFRFHHQNFDHLKKLLEKEGRKKIIVSESLFSMEGDITDLDTLTEIASESGAFLYVDDAHALGVLGHKGLGLTAGRKGIDLALGTFGKGFGCFGAYILCSQKIKEHLIQTCGGLIYTTSMPPPLVGAAEAALDLIPKLDQERDYLKDISVYLRAQLLDKGYNIGRSSTSIIPLIVGSEEKALSLEKKLLEGGCFSPAIRPPTVEKGESRVRLTLTARHTKEQIEQLLSCV